MSPNFLPPLLPSFRSLVNLLTHIHEHTSTRTHTRDTVVQQSPGSPAGLVFPSAVSPTDDLVYDEEDDDELRQRMMQLHQEMAVDQELRTVVSGLAAAITTTTTTAGQQGASVVTSLDSCITDDQKQRMIRQHRNTTWHRHEIAERNQLLIKRRDSINRNWKPFKNSMRGGNNQADRRLLFRRQQKPPSSASPTTPSSAILSPTMTTTAIVHALHHQHHHHQRQTQQTQQDQDLPASASCHSMTAAAESAACGLRRHHSLSGSFRGGSGVGGASVSTSSRLISCRPYHIPSHIPTPVKVCSPLPSTDSAAGTPQSPFPMNHEAVVIDGDRTRSLIHEVRTMSPGQSLQGMFYCSAIVSRKNSDQNRLGPVLAAASGQRLDSQSYEPYFAKGLIHTCTGDKETVPNEDHANQAEDEDALIRRCSSSSAEDFDLKDLSSGKGKKRRSDESTTESCKRCAADQGQRGS